MLQKLRQTFLHRIPHFEMESDFTQSAVLVPLIEEKNGLSVLFEVRSHHLSWQPGEVCFPGGRIETSDPHPSMTAVRETTEELGLAPQHIELLGPLDVTISPIGVVIYPFVGYLSSLETLCLNPDEVGEYFTVPVETLLALEPLVAHTDAGTKACSDFPFALLPPGYTTEWRTRLTYPVHFYQYQGHLIWGLTAKILRQFLRIYTETASNA